MSTNIFSDIASQLDPQGVLATVVENPDVLRTTGNSLNLVLGERVKFRATLNDVSYDAYATLRSANLHRLSLIEHTTRKGHTSPLVTGILKPVKMDIDIVIDGQVMSIQEFLRNIGLSAARNNAIQNRKLAIAEATNVPVSKVELSEFDFSEIEEFIQGINTPQSFSSTLENIGLRFETGMPIFFQHFGSNIDEYNKLRDFFKEHGAENVFGKIKAEKRGNIKEAWQMPMLNERAAMLGPSVVGFEVNRADRTQSQTYLPDQGLYGQGFVDFVDAVFTNYMRVVGMRASAAAIETDNAVRAKAENWSSERRKAEDDKAKELRKLSSDWTSNWSGSQQRILVDPKDSTNVTKTNIFDPTQMDCGKITLAFGPETHSFNLWTDNRNRSLVSSTVEETFASSEDGEVTPAEWD